MIIESSRATQLSDGDGGDILRVAGGGAAGADEAREQTAGALRENGAVHGVRRRRRRFREARARVVVAERLDDAVEHREEHPERGHHTERRHAPLAFTCTARVHVSSLECHFQSQVTGFNRA